MLRPFVALFAATLLAGCVTARATGVPADYSGPVAMLQDSAIAVSDSEADLFYATHVDGQAVQNSREATRARNYGRGPLYLHSALLSRPIPARETTVRIAGRTEHAAPILALTMAEYALSGDVHFTPEPDKTYIVRGRFRPQYSVVWIEDADTKTVVGKVEVNGSAKLGIFEK